MATAILATLNLKKYITSTEKYFVYFLWFTIIVEIVGVVMRDFFEIANLSVYNFYMLASFLFFLYWYRSILKRSLLKWIVGVFALFFSVVAIWNMATQSWGVYHKYTFVTGALFTLICAIFHFWQLLNSDEILEVKYKLSFWISTGLLLFNMGMIPFMLLSEYFNFRGNAYYIFIIIGLNLILYGCYSIGFLWTKEKYNRS